MARVKLEHFNVMTARLRETVDFYKNTLGLYEGFYPTELGPGAWMYDSTDTPVLHMQEVDPADFAAHAAKIDARLGDLRRGLGQDVPDETGAIDHIAFACEDMAATRDRLQKLGIPYRESGVASAAVRQIFLRDPNGVILELNFRQ